MTIAELNMEILEVISRSTETELEITENTHLLRQMGMTSVEIMMLISDLEDHFDITIPANSLRGVQIVADLQSLVLEAIRGNR